MTRKEYEKIVRRAESEIEGIKDRILDAFWDRLHTIEGVESPAVDGVDEDVIEDCWDAMDIARRITRRTAEMVAEGWDVDWEWVKGYFR